MISHTIGGGEARDPRVEPEVEKCEACGEGLHDLGLVPKSLAGAAVKIYR
jgi:hypothetical protein